MASQGEVAVLLHQTLRVFPVLVQRLLRPPGLEVPGPVVPPPVVIEGVAELVADGEADTSVVEDGRPASSVERLLENTQGEDDLVHHGRVVGVDGLGGGLPGVPRHRPGQSSEHLRPGVLLSDIFQQRLAEAAVFFSLPIKLCQLFLLKIILVLKTAPPPRK